MQTQIKLVWSVCTVCHSGGLGVGGNLGVIVVRVCEPELYIIIHIPALWKNGPIHILVVQNVDLFIYCPLIFYIHLLLVVDRYCSQFIEYQENKQPQKISEWKNVRIYQDVRKVGPFTYKSRKIGPVIYFLLKKGANHIPGSAEKGGHSARTSILCHR